MMQDACERRGARPVLAATLVIGMFLPVSEGRAQVPNDAFLFVDRLSHFLYSFDPGVSLSLRASLGGGALSIGTAGHGIVSSYYYDNLTTLSYIAAEIDLNTGTYAGLLNTLPTPLFGNPLFAPGEDRLWIVGKYGGDVASVARNGLLQTATVHGTAFATPPSGGVQSVETNGRDLFITDSRSLLAIDMERPFAVRTLIPLGAISHLMMGRNGLLYIWATVGNLAGLIGVDPVTGSMTLVLPGSEFAGGSVVIGYNPWTDMMMTCDYWIWWRQVGVPAGTPWQTVLWNPMSSSTISDIATNAEPPFVIRGSGCVNALGLEPRLGWSGLPRQGGTFDLKLRFAEPNGIAIFWLGRSGTFWPTVGALPYDAVPLGAPGCRILASADFSMLVPVDAQGSAVLTSQVPVDPAIAGFKLYAQTASLSGANALGLAASESLVIRFR